MCVRVAAMQGIVPCAICSMQNELLCGNTRRSMLHADFALQLFTCLPRYLSRLYLPAYDHTHTITARRWMQVPGGSMAVVPTTQPPNWQPSIISLASYLRHRWVGVHHMGSCRRWRVGGSACMRDKKGRNSCVHGAVPVRSGK